MGEEDKNLEWQQFLEGLRAELSDGHINYAQMEQRLFDRIEKLNSVDPLLELKVHVNDQHVDWDSLENKLFHQITEYQEYDETIGEYISRKEDLPDAQWERLQDKIESDILKVQELEDWESVIKSQEMLGQGDWERIEEKLLNRIEEEQSKDSWEQILESDDSEHVLPEIGSPDRLQAMMDAVDKLEPWEAVLKRDEHLSLEAFEDVEENIMARIERKEKLEKISPASTWLGLGWFGALNPVVKSLVVVLLVSAIGWYSWDAYKDDYRDLPTLVYKSQGEIKEDLKKTYYPGSQIESKKNTSLTLVNQRGFVELENGSKLSILSANRKNVAYKLDPLSKKGEQSAKFFVTKSSIKGQYKIHTPDYEVRVLGTYFEMQESAPGKFSTKVLEGKVEIATHDNEVLEVKAGQSFYFDIKQGRYVILENGDKVSREAIAKPPSVDKLENYASLKISTNIDGAVIYLNGLKMGVAPLAALQPQGKYQVVIQKDGYITKDTTIFLSEDNAMVYLESQPEKQATRVARAKPKLLPAKEEKVEVVEPIEAPVKKVEPKSSISEMLVKANLLENKSWKEAAAIYQHIITASKSSAIEKENAHFSLARLKAKHFRSPLESKKAFENYLKNYPKGIFTGESWLRLAELEIKDNPVKAAEYYLRYIRKYPNHYRVPSLMHRVGLIYMQEQNYDQAIKYFKSSLDNLVNTQDSLRRNVVQSYQRALEAKGDMQGAKSLR